MSSAAAWRRAGPQDLDAVMAIQDVAHALLPERREVLADKMRLFGEGSLVLVEGETCVGYGLSHPWIVGGVPPLDALLGRLPERPDCLFVHDVALLPAARGKAAAGVYMGLMRRVAQERGFATMALVSVYGTAPLWRRHGFRIMHSLALASKLADYGDTARYMTAEASAFP